MKKTIIISRNMSRKQKYKCEPIDLQWVGNKYSYIVTYIYCVENV
jgi:hypothetical protein